jgi:hypothetical protein
MLMTLHIEESGFMELLLAVIRLVAYRYIRRSR